VYWIVIVDSCFSHFVAGAGIYRARKEYYRCRFGASKVTLEYNRSLF
jgi:hypothetical protein